jgi:hypothetical protein
MQIEDPHGVGDIVPALTQDQRDLEESEFRILVCSFMVQMYGNMIGSMAQVPASQRNNTLLGIMQHQMNASQKLAVRMNKRYAYLLHKSQLGKMS